MKKRSNTSTGDSGIGTVGPTGEVNGWIVTGFNVFVHTGAHGGIGDVGADGDGED